MSKIKVDTIESRNGTLTVGAANDTVNYAAGSIPNASLENSAITINGSSVSLGGSTDISAGTDWQSSLKTSDFTAVAGEGYFVDTSSGAITMTLPAGSVGDVIELVDVTGSFQTNNLTITANASEKIQGSTNDKTLDGQNDGLILVYSGATNGWVVPASTEVQKIPTLSSITGVILAGASSDLTLAGTNFLSSNLIVNFTQSSDSVNEDVTVTPTSDVAATVTVPSAVFNNVTAGNDVTMKVTNSDGLESNTLDTTVASLPTGGTITTSGNDRIHTFTTSGTFSVSTGFSRSASFLIIAGGGGGGVGSSGNDCGGGGAGAGGYRSSFNNESSGGGGSAESAFTFSGGTNYTVTVGAGGAGGQSPGSNGSTGNDSSVFSKTSNGGGSGSNRNDNGGSGGSGGGCSCDSGSGGSGTSNQGFAGAGGGITAGGATRGGGGAGAAGGNTSGSTSGAGGNGVASTITGSSVTRGGGGSGGGGAAVQSGGTGGGGTGGTRNGNDGGNGSANTGGGGGGAGGNAGSGTDGGNGGSGIVVIRYTV